MAARLPSAAAASYAAPCQPGRSVIHAAPRQLNDGFGRTGSTNPLYHMRSGGHVVRENCRSGGVEQSFSTVTVAEHDAPAPTELMTVAFPYVRFSEERQELVFDLVHEF